MQKFLLPDFSTVMLGLIEYGETNARFEQYSGGSMLFTIALLFRKKQRSCEERSLKLHFFTAP